jgi:hypothetical protein
MMRWIGALLYVLAGLAAAQQDGPPNAILLIAKPALLDPNFRQTVVLDADFRLQHGRRDPQPSQRAQARKPGSRSMLAGR